MKAVSVLKQITFQGPDSWVDGCVARMLQDGANLMSPSGTEPGYVIIKTFAGPMEAQPFEIDALPQHDWRGDAKRQTIREAFPTIQEAEEQCNRSKT